VEAKIAVPRGEHDAVRYGADSRQGGGWRGKRVLPRVFCAEAHVTAQLFFAGRGGCSCASCISSGFKSMCWECKHGVHSVLRQGIHQMLHQGRDGRKARKTTVHRCRTEHGHQDCDWRNDPRESSKRKEMMTEEGSGGDSGHGTD
jgi:hypothetical protein